jgi:hypothetical protein
VDVTTFQVGSAVIHDVPRPEQGDDIVLTDAPVPLDAQLRGYLRRKIVESLEHRGLDVIADPEGSPVVRDAVAAILGDEEQLVTASKGIAGHLDKSQNRRNTAGLLIVLTGAVDDAPAVAVLKLEREQGLRLRIESKDGQSLVDLQFLRDLTLTDKTKIFKTSIFQIEKAGVAETMFGRVSDDQRGRDDGTGVATFFLSTFLGCKLRTNPAKATMDFVAAAEAFVNEDVTGDDRKGRYLVALQAALQDQQLDLVPKQFANSQLEPDDRPAFLSRISEGGLDPQVAFTKDTSLVKTKGFRLTFSHGMVLIGSQQDLRERVELPAEGKIAEPVKLRDSIQMLRGR